jgi:hypothetical protein
MYINTIHSAHMPSFKESLPIDFDAKLIYEVIFDVRVKAVAFAVSSLSLGDADECGD